MMFNKVWHAYMLNPMYVCKSQFLFIYFRNRLLLISWRRWYTEDCMRIPACEILKDVGKRFADALVNCWIDLASFSFFSSFSFKLNPILFRMTSCEIYYQLHRLQPGCNFGVARRLFPSTLYNSHRLQMIMKLRFNVRNVVLYVLFVPHPLIFSDIFSYYLRFRFDVAWGIWLPATEILEILSLRYNKHNKRETWAAKVGYRSGFRS